VLLPPARLDTAVSSDLVDIFALAVLATINPTLLGAVTLMLLLPNPRRLMLGYLLGAYTTSFIAGMLILFALHGSRTETTSKHTISPLEDIVVGVFALTIAWVLQTGRDEPIRERRQRRKDAKLKAREEAGKPTQSLPLRMLGKGDPKITFVVGALLSFPGIYYLSALDHIHKLKPGAVGAILLVVGFCVMQQIFIELPLLGYAFAPERTSDAVEAFKGWMARKGRGVLTVLAAVIGIWLVTRGAIGLL
jgi:Sap, sulfolipid-1-addressing protein